MSLESPGRREIRVFNRLRDLRDPSRSVTGWRELLPRGRTLGLEERLWEVVWPRRCG